eukprot:1180119-Prorocentrum_minimum.AAC.1
MSRDDPSRQNYVTIMSLLCHAATSPGRPSEVTRGLLLCHAAALPGGAVIGLSEVTRGLLLCHAPARVPYRQLLLRHTPAELPYMWCLLCRRRFRETVLRKYIAQWHEMVLLGSHLKISQRRKAEKAEWAERAAKERAEKADVSLLMIPPVMP